MRTIAGWIKNNVLSNDQRLNDTSGQQFNYKKLYKAPEPTDDFPLTEQDIFAIFGRMNKRVFSFLPDFLKLDRGKGNIYYSKEVLDYIRDNSELIFKKFGSVRYNFYIYEYRKDKFWPERFNTRYADIKEDLIKLGVMSEVTAVRKAKDLKMYVYNDEYGVFDENFIGVLNAGT